MLQLPAARKLSCSRERKRKLLTFLSQPSQRLRPVVELLYTGLKSSLPFVGGRGLQPEAGDLFCQISLKRLPFSDALCRFTYRACRLHRLSLSLFDATCEDTDVGERLRVLQRDLAIHAIFQSSNRRVVVVLLIADRAPLPEVAERDLREGAEFLPSLLRLNPRASQRRRVLFGQGKLTASAFRRSSRVDNRNFERR